MGASAWHSLMGTPGYAAGASGIVTIPKGGALITVVLHSTSGGSFSIFGGASIPIPAGSSFWRLDLVHANFQAQGAGAQAQLVFTGTDSYFVHYNAIGNI